MEDDQIIQQDVSAESSPEVVNDSAAQAAPATEVAKPAEAPFHEHPRFKEIIEQNRGYKSELEQAKQTLAQLQKQMTEFSAPKPQPAQAHPFISDLEKINPAYAEYLRNLEGQVKEFSGTKSQLEQLRNQAVLKEYESNVTKMFTEHKVSEPLQAVYRELLDSKASTGKYGMQDLPVIFKEIHGRLSGVMESQKKEALNSYVSDKTKAANVPTTAPKTPAVSKKAEGWKPSGNAEQDVIDIARMAVEKANASKI